MDRAGAPKFCDAAIWAVFGKQRNVTRWLQPAAEPGCEEPQGRRCAIAADQDGAGA